MFWSFLELYVAVKQPFSFGTTFCLCAGIRMLYGGGNVPKEKAVQWQHKAPRNAQNINGYVFFKVCGLEQFAALLCFPLVLLSPHRGESWRSPAAGDALTRDKCFTQPRIKTPELSFLSVRGKCSSQLQIAQSDVFTCNLFVRLTVQNPKPVRLLSHKTKKSSRSFHLGSWNQHMFYIYAWQMTWWCISMWQHLVKDKSPTAQINESWILTWFDLTWMTKGSINSKNRWQLNFFPIDLTFGGMHSACLNRLISSRILLYTFLWLHLGETQLQPPSLHFLSGRRRGFFFFLFFLNHPSSHHSSLFPAGVRSKRWGRSRRWGWGVFSEIERHS